MATRCRWCQRDVAPDGARNWWCQACHKFDATECLACRKRGPFPLAASWITAEQAERSPLIGTDRLLAEKSWVMCAWCYHDAYFVVRLDDGRHECRLCWTTWTDGDATDTMHPGIPVRGRDW